MTHTRIYCFVSGDNFLNQTLFLARRYYTACALTEKGKWIAGAVSQDPDTAVTRVMAMAERKASTMLSGSTTIVRIDDTTDPRLTEALDLAFASMP